MRAPFVRDPKAEWALGTVLAKRAAAFPERVFVETPAGERLLYGEADRAADQIAALFAALAGAPGARVGVMLPNGLDAVRTWLGLGRAGLVQVSVNTNYCGAFLAHVLADAAVPLLVAHRSYLPRLVPLLPELPALRRILVTGAADEPSPALGPIEVIELEAALAHHSRPLLARPSVAARPSVRAYDLASIMYTSGTTGPSKGVLMPHAHCYLLGLGALENLRLTEDDCYYVTLPLFHANALFMQLYASLIRGCRVVLAEKFSASAWLPEIRRFGCTITNTIGVMTEFVLRQPPHAEDATTPLRLVLAVPTAPALAEPFAKRFGCQIVEAYGMTEVNMPLYTPLDAPRPGSCGQPYAEFFEVLVVDPETDEPCATGEVGEIVVRPRAAFGFMQGYLGLPERTAEAFRNLWFHTGDAGRRDEDGYFYFVDRIKDCIRRRGENISSFELEQVLLSHPAVREAAVVAVPSDVPGGEDEIKACLVPNEGQRIDPAELLRAIEPALPAFALPRYIELLSSLPRTPTEKVQKVKLRAAGIGPAVFDRQR